MAKISVYKRTSEFIDCSELVKELGELGLMDTLQKYYNKPIEKEAKSIVAGPSFLQFLNKLFQIQLTTGDIIHLQSADHSKYLHAVSNWNMGRNNRITIKQQS